MSFSARSGQAQTTPSLSPADNVMSRLHQLGMLSSESGALTRLYLTPEHKAAAALVRRWMAEAGMTASIDAIGNVVGRYSGLRPGCPTLLIGSHIDTVRDAGRYDGCLGVVAAIEAVAVLARAGERLPYAIEVLAFGDEEGVRFPEALAGSRAIAGTFQREALDAVDPAGIPLRAALKTFGGDPEAVAGLSRRGADVFGYLELHIEQGPVLEAEDLPVGIVTAIAGATRFEVTVTGTAGHAGTVPMRLRRDAFAAVAEMALAVERIACEMSDIVATIGRVAVAPGAVNVIPSRASFTVDLRSPSDAARKTAMNRFDAAFAGIAEARGVGHATKRFYDEAAAPCTAAFREGLAGAIRRHGVRPLELPSGAGHDGLAMIGLCPIGMLFVRCAGGISHNPAESVTGSDVGVSLDILVDLLRNLDPARFAARG